MEEIEILDHGSDKCWAQWQDLVRSEEWTSDDNTVLGMTPTLQSTRIVLARKKKTGDFCGAVIWNEYDNVAFLGFYILMPEMRGKGVGSLIWQRAMKRIPADHILGLHAVPDMAPKYQAKNTPWEAQLLCKYKFEWNQLSDALKDHINPQQKTKLVSDLNEQEFEMLCKFDKKVTGRDRAEFLKLFYEFEFSEGCVVFGENGDIMACAGITSTGHEGSHLYKIAPVYASSMEMAATVMQKMVTWAGNRDPDSKILIHMISDSMGERELIPILNKNHNGAPKIVARSLFSKQYHNPINTKMLYVPHNNSGHMDV